MVQPLIFATTRIPRPTLTASRILKLCFRFCWMVPQANLNILVIVTGDHCSVFQPTRSRFRKCISGFKQGCNARWAPTRCKSGNNSLKYDNYLHLPIYFLPFCLKVKSHGPSLHGASVAPKYRVLVHGVIGKRMKKNSQKRSYTVHPKEITSFP